MTGKFVEITVLLPPWIVIALVVSILILKIYTFLRYHDWFILALGVPLLYTLWIYVAELMTEGTIDKPTARFSLVIVLIVLLMNRIFDLFKLRIEHWGNK